MAIEWVLMDARPARLQQILQAADQMAARMTGPRTLNFSTPSTSEDFTEDESGVFSSTVLVTCSDREAFINIDADLVIEDDPTLPLSGLIYGTVTAQRALLSVAGGLILAGAWLQVAQGDLSGPGLDSVYTEDTVDQFVSDLTFPGDRDPISAATRIGRVVYGSDPNVRFS